MTAARLLPLSLSLILLPASAAPALAAGEPALVLHEGSVARRQLVAIGRDLEVHGEARSDVAALDGSVRVTGTVDGDVIVVGGAVELAGTARIGGDVFALGGAVVAAPGASIGGRTVSYPTATGAWITLLEGPAMGLPATSPLVIAGKLALLAAWLALVMLFFAAAGRQVLSTSAELAAEPLRSFVTGVVGVIALVLTTLLFSAFAAALVGVPLLVLLVVLALVLKLWGMVAVFHAAGDWLLRRLLRRRPPALTAATLGLLALGLLKFVPYVGIWVWSAATFLGVGATLSTKFGSRERWFGFV